MHTLWGEGGGGGGDFCPNLPRLRKWGWSDASKQDEVIRSLRNGAPWSDETPPWCHNSAITGSGLRIVVRERSSVSITASAGQRTEDPAGLGQKLPLLW